MMTHANFLTRAVAYLINIPLFFLIHLLSWEYLLKSESLEKFGFNIFLYIIFILLPLSLFWVFYKGLFTHYFGGDLGKLVTGLKVTNENYGKLTLKRSLFRYIIGYPFSSVIFGLGFLSIINDPEKQAWHDKVVGSKVVVFSNLFPFGLFTLLSLLGINGYLIFDLVVKFLNSPLKEELIKLLNT